MYIHPKRYRYYILHSRAHENLNNCFKKFEISTLITLKWNGYKMLLLTIKTFEISTLIAMDKKKKKIINK